MSIVDTQEVRVQERVADPFDELFRERSVTRELGAGEMLYLAGTPSERVHLLRSGVILHVSRDAGGTETILGLATAGELIDPTAAIDSSFHQFDALAARRCLVSSIDSATFRAALSTDIALGLALIHALARRVRWIAETAHERASQQVSGRVAGRLLDLARLLGRPTDDAIELEMPIDQTTFASLAGTSRESACKALRRLKADGVLDYKGRRLRILRPDALSYMRCASRR